MKTSLKSEQELRENDVDLQSYEEIQRLWGIFYENDDPAFRRQGDRRDTLNRLSYSFRRGFIWRGTITNDEYVYISQSLNFFNQDNRDEREQIQRYVEMRNIFTKYFTKQEEEFDWDGYCEKTYGEDLI